MSDPLFNNMINIDVSLKYSDFIKVKWIRWSCIDSLDPSTISASIDFSSFLIKTELKDEPLGGIKPIGMGKEGIYDKINGSILNKFSFYFPLIYPINFSYL